MPTCWFGWLNAAVGFCGMLVNNHLGSLRSKFIWRRELQMKVPRWKLWKSLANQCFCFLCLRELQFDMTWIARELVSWSFLLTLACTLDVFSSLWKIGYGITFSSSFSWASNSYPIKKISSCNKKHPSLDVSWSVNSVILLYPSLPCKSCILSWNLLCGSLLFRVSR